MPEYWSLTDAEGNRIPKRSLLEEQGGPTVTGVRQALSDHPENGLTPARLALLLREAEEGDPIRQMELAEAVEEKYLHYQGVLGTRKRAVTRLPITVESYSDDAGDVADADLVREWLRRDTLRQEMMDILDAIGKGISFTEICWDTSEGQFWPVELKWRPPTWFTFDHTDLETPYLRGEGGQPEALRPYTWIRHRSQAKSGSPIRAGLIRGVSWVYLFQNLGWKSWIEFGTRFGMPFRLGKYGQGASKDDRDTLMRAIRALGADFGGIIPESMAIELIEAKVSGNVTVFKDLVAEADTRVSIAVLGQNLTTRVEGGSYAASQTHEGVREDIRDADADDLAVTLNRDLVRPLIDLNRGPRKRGRYPRLRIAEPDAIDMQEMRENLKTFVPMGMKVGMSTIRDKIGLPDPDPDEQVLMPPGAVSDGRPHPQLDDNAAVKGVFNGSGAPHPVPSPPRTAAHASAPPGASTAIDDIDALVDQLDAAAMPAMDRLINAVRDVLDRAESIPDAIARLEQAYPSMALDDLAGVIGQAMMVADLSGRAEVTDA